MEYYAILVSGDKIELTKEDYDVTYERMLRNKTINVRPADGSIIRVNSIIYLGVSGEAEVEKPPVKDTTKKTDKKTDKK